MTNFIKSQQAKAREKFDEAFAEKLESWGLQWNDSDTYELLRDVVAQTIKDTTAKVRKVLGEVELHGNEKSLGKTAYNELYRKVTQELNSLGL